MAAFFLVSLLVTMASATTMSSDDKHGENLINWLRSKDGIFNPKLEIRRDDPSDPTSRFGMFTNGKISDKEILIEIPHACLLTAEALGVGDGVYIDLDPEGETFAAGTVVSVNSNMCTVEYESGVTETVHEERLERIDDDEEEMCYTVRNLINEMRLGSDSKYAAYANYLLDQRRGQLPEAWSDAGQALLGDVLHGGGTGSKLPPFNIERHWWKDECRGEDDPFEENASMIVTQRGWDDVLIPVYDMMSHRNGHWLNTYSAPLEEALDGRSNVKVHASRDIQAGEEIYTTYNFCSDCEGRAFGYGTPDILRDYGFVEQYPQRWFLRHQVSFELDEIMNVNGSGTGDLEVNWLTNSKISEEGIAFCKLHLERLQSLAQTKFESPIEEVSKHELEVVKQYTQALITAMEHAIDHSNGDGKKSDEL